ncbi:MAG TPA: GNAT family N-acetyltransferase [Alphaproteobacteria bacterium]|nr:GNAT family N-acetyltransferase [Alphaproteobacteria bacterium]
MAVLETERLRLRPFRADDVAPLVALLGEWQVVRWLSRMPWPYTADHAADWVGTVMEEHEAGRPGHFAIAWRGDDVLVGGIGLTPQGDDAELGYWLGRPYWGQGYGAEAARSLLAYAFDGLGLRRVHAYTAPGNERSQRLLAGLGMRRVGDTPFPTPLRGGITSGPHYELLRSDYAAAAAP